MMEIKLEDLRRKTLETGKKLPYLKLICWRGSWYIVDRYNGTSPYNLFPLIDGSFRFDKGIDLYKAMNAGYSEKVGDLMARLILESTHAIGSNTNVFSKPGIYLVRDLTEYANCFSTENTSITILT